MKLRLGTRADLINSVYFSLAGIACLWLITLYGWESKSALYLIAGLLVSQTISFTACLLAFSPSCVGALKTAPIPAPLARKLLRLTVMVVPIPAIAFCSATFFCIATYDESQSAEFRMLQMWRMEQICFGKSRLFAFVKKKADPSFYQRYKDRVHARLINAIAESGCNFRATVAFTVLRDGSIENVQLCNSSGMERFDQAALRVVKSFSPYPAIPANQPDQLMLNVNVGNQGVLNAKSTNTDFNKYVERTAYKIFKMWDPPEEINDMTTSFQLRIRPDGTLSHISRKTTGIDAFDQAALIALNSACPFEKFPAAIDHDEQISLEFTSFTGSQNGLTGFSSDGELPKPDYNSIELICEGLPASIIHKFADHFHNAVAKSWHVPKSIPDRGTLVTFDLSPEGSASNAQVVISSGSKELDQSALVAVQHTRTDRFNYSSIPLPAGLWFCPPAAVYEVTNMGLNDGRYVTAIPYPHPAQMEPWMRAEYNDAELAIKLGHFKSAIDTLEHLHSKAQKNKIIRERLIEAYKKYAQDLGQRRKWKLALKQLHTVESLYPGTGENDKAMDSVVKKMHLDPNSTKDRLKLCLNSLADGDPVGASIECGKATILLSKLSDNTSDFNWTAVFLRK